MPARSPSRPDRTAEALDGRAPRTPLDRAAALRDEDVEESSPISETSAMLLPEVVQRFMAGMQPRGVSFALDDLGAGLIALRHLKDFPFRCVKIDRTWVAGLDRHPDNQVLCEALITVAHRFETFAVAEGVGTEAEALRALGVDCLQGYPLGRPQPTP